MVSLLSCLAARLLDVRGRVYELLTHCIPPDVIIKVSVDAVCWCECECDCGYGCLGFCGVYWCDH